MYAECRAVRGLLGCASLGFVMCGVFCDSAEESGWEAGIRNRRPRARFELPVDIVGLTGMDLGYGGSCPGEAWGSWSS